MIKLDPKVVRYEDIQMDGPARPQTNFTEVRLQKEKKFGGPFFPGDQYPQVKTFSQYFQA